MELSIFDLVQDHVEVQIGDNLLPDYPLKNRAYRIVTEKIDIFSVNAKNAERLKAEGYDMSDEAKEERKKRKLDMRAQNFSEGVDYFRNFKFIDVSLLLSDPNGWNYFNEPNTPQMLNLMASIQSIGIFTPLIVRPTGDGDFYILCGDSRAEESYNLYKSTKDERYRYVPCFIVEDVEEYFIRTLMIDSNTNYRTISQDDELLQRVFTRKLEEIKRA